MESQYKVESYTYAHLEGHVAVPKYQRNLVWSENQKQDFIDNISKGYPFGSILLYRYEGDKELSLIDGLQRVSTLREYKKNPEKFFTEYEPFVERFYQVLEDSGLSRDEVKRQGTEPKIEPLLKESLTAKDDLFFLVGEINEILPITKGNGELGQALTRLQVDLKKAAQNYLDLNDITIPSIEFRGEESQLPDVFANLNQGGTKLSKYQVFAAHWMRYDIALSDNEMGRLILNRVIDRYQNMQKSRDMEIIGFDEDDMCKERKINLSEYCYALGELIVEASPVFWNARRGSDKREDTCNVVGYLSTAIALGVDIRNLNELPSQIGFFEVKGFAERLAERVVDEFKTINNQLGQWLRLPGLSPEVLYESGAITDMQALSFFAALWHAHYEIDQVSHCINEKFDYAKNGYSQICNNLLAYCVTDVVGKSWQGSGDSRLANTYVNNATTVISYRRPMSKDVLKGRLAAWYEEALSKPSVNIEKTSKLLLCIYTAPNRMKYTAPKYDIEHVIARARLQEKDVYQSEKSVYQSEGIPGGVLGNLMFLVEGVNRAKREKSLYTYNDSQSVSNLDKEYLELTDYPSQKEIDQIEVDLKRGEGSSAKALIKTRGQKMIDRIADLLSNDAVS